MYNFLMKFKRNTVLSSSVSSLFEETNSPISLKDIISHLKTKDLFPNKTTLYRILDKLQESQHIRIIRLNNGLTYYEKATSNQAHFFCTICNSIFSFSKSIVSNISGGISQLLPSSAFKIDHHDLNLYGKCNSCTTNT